MGRWYPLPIRRGGLGSVVSSPSGVWDGALAEIDFGAFCHQNLTSGANNFHKFPISQPIKFCAIRGDHTVHKHIYEEWGRVAMAHLNSQCPWPPFYPPLLWGSGGKAPIPEADDILALEHTLFALSWVIPYADKNRQLPDKMSIRYTTLPNYTAWVHDVIVVCMFVFFLYTWTLYYPDCCCYINNTT